MVLERGPTYQSIANPQNSISKDATIRQKDPKEVMGLEVKCPTPGTHLRFLELGIIPGDYQAQIAHYFIVVPNLDTVAYLSYDDRFIDEGAQVKIKLVSRAEHQPVIEKYTRFIHNYENWLEPILGNYKGVF